MGKSKDISVRVTRVRMTPQQQSRALEALDLFIAARVKQAITVPAEAAEEPPPPAASPLECDKA
jgi:hypothetical protein